MLIQELKKGGGNMLVYIYLGIAAAFIILSGLLMYFMKKCDFLKQENKQLQENLKQANTVIENAQKNEAFYKKEQQRLQQEKEALARKTASDIIKELYPHIQNNDTAKAKDLIQKFVNSIKKLKVKK